MFQWYLSTIFITIDSVVFTSRITAEGVELLGSGLEICPQLAFLNLSYNEFGDKGMEILAVKFCYNTSIMNLNLSHNNLTHKTGFYLAETMEENYTLQHVDLSWNQMAEEQGLKKFLQAAAEHNESILSLDLSWNTLSGEKTANILKNFIGQHRTLQELNLSHNRLDTAAEATRIAKGISSTPSLKEINLSYNGITADTAFALLSSISTKTKLRTLRLDNVWVKPEFERLRRELESLTRMKVIIEGVSGGFGVKGPDMQTLLLKRAHHLGYLPKKAKNKKDFGWFLLRLKQTGSLAPVKKAKFEKLVTEDKIKFDEGMVDELCKKFKDDNKKIDLNLMLDKYLLLYPETALPTPKEKKKKKGSKEKTKSLEKHVEEDVKEETEEIKESTNDVTEPVSDKKSGESIKTQLEVNETEEVKEIKKPVEVDEKIIEPEIPVPDKDVQHTEDKLSENQTESEDVRNKIENVELQSEMIDENVIGVQQENVTETNEEIDAEVNVDDTNAEKQKEEVTSRESESKLKKWRVVLGS